MLKYSDLNWLCDLLVIKYSNTYIYFDIETLTLTSHLHVFLNLNLKPWSYLVNP